jgi:hypothetical protein
MKEAFLHFIWRYKRFDTTDLQTVDGATIEVVDFGEHNMDAGPDFLNARIKIGGVLWAGNIEMHLKASDWYLHQHESDKAYDSVILHVVLENDCKIYRNNGEEIPCLTLRPYIKERLLGVYQKIEHNAHWIPCQHEYFQVATLTKELWYSRVLIERLESKTQAIEAQLIASHYAWEEIFYQSVAKNFGVKMNELPFEMLSRALPLLTIAKHKNNLFQIEALVFGQAGLLDNRKFEDEYPTLLQKEYQFLKQKFNLQPLEGSLWKFSRLRPANFPTIRLAQFAKLLHQSVHLFSKIIEAEDIKQFYQLFSVELEGYWVNRYVFDKASKSMKKHLGQDAIHLILINSVVPFLFLYGKNKADDAFKDKALRLLEALPYEKNSVIEGWIKLGEPVADAAKSQSLLQQKKHYCDKKRCLECAIGVAILRQTN